MAIALANSDKLNCLNVLREHGNNYDEAVSCIVAKYSSEAQTAAAAAITQAVHGCYLRNFMLFTPSGFSEALNYLQAHYANIYAAVGISKDRYTTQQVIQLIMLRDYPDLLPELSKHLAKFA